MYDLSKQFPNEFMVTVASFKSSTQHDVHFSLRLMSPFREKQTACFRAQLPMIEKRVLEFLSQIRSGHPPWLAFSPKYGHFWLIEFETPTAVMPQSRLQNSSQQAAA